MLIRFTRQHSDDNEIVAAKYGPYPGSVAYFSQLVAELDEGGLQDSDKAYLVFGELAIPAVDNDLYFLYLEIPALPNETPEALAKRLQLAYDDGSVAGWFQIIGN